ncbi:MAG: ATP-binding protein, partial [Chloroflexi bacterium]|nr:ATP-binding protein [Chloroflexota bacterium]
IFVKKPENLPDLLKHLSISAAQALKEMRLLLYEMRLQPLLGMNLVDAINLRLASVEHRAATEAILFLDETITWPKEWDTELYPLAVEALNNALKHGRAKKVEVRIGKEQGAFYMTIRDNGRGLDLQSVRPGGMGLQNMNERAKRLGGQLAIKSQPGEGTEITVIIENGAD